jgi:hypothetical protein
MIMARIFFAVVTYSEILKQEQSNPLNSMIPIFKTIQT